jgi:hypothetical protein
MRRVMTAVFAAVCVLTGAALAQQESKMPMPGPEHKRLAYFVGTWTSEGEMKPGPYGPGGKFTSTDKNEWFPGDFFVVMHSSSSGSMGQMHELAVMGYNAEDKQYTYDGYSSMGEHEVFTGTLAGDTWTWLGESKMGGKMIKGRYSIKELSPTSFDFKYEYSLDGTTWTNAMEGKATKK